MHEKTQRKQTVWLKQKLQINETKTTTEPVFKVTNDHAREITESIWMQVNLKNLGKPLHWKLLIRKSKGKGPKKTTSLIELATFYFVWKASVSNTPHFPEKPMKNNSMIRFLVTSTFLFCFYSTGFAQGDVRNNCSNLRT